jgi:hypothetical protein
MDHSLGKPERIAPSRHVAGPFSGPTGLLPLEILAVKKEPSFG